jgi:hypothetical protein
VGKLSAMNENILLDLLPEFNSDTLQWELRETDERDNTLEVYAFSTEEEAENFIDQWIAQREKSLDNE